MPSYKNILETIGPIPPVKPNSLSSRIELKIHSNLEIMNSKGSINDRLKRSMIEDSPYISETHIAIEEPIKDNRTIFIMSDEINEEKIDLFKASGSDIVVLPSSGLPGSYHDEIDPIEKDSVPGMMVCRWIRITLMNLI